VTVVNHDVAIDSLKTLIQSDHNKTAPYKKKQFKLDSQRFPSH